MIDVRFKLNGERAAARVLPAAPAVRVLRDTLGLTGTKRGCGEGECGACTILLDGEAVNSCLLPAALLDGREVTTIEGLVGPGGSLHPVQQAYVEAGAVQCGFCTPGMIMRTVAFLREHPDPTDDQIVRSIEGNLCEKGEDYARKELTNPERGITSIVEVVGGHVLVGQEFDGRLVPSKAGRGGNGQHQGQEQHFFPHGTAFYLSC